jgi:hypothetical protein
VSEATAQFRALSMPGRKPRGEWVLERIEVGTRSSCALVLNDPVVADRHCAFVFANGSFHVEDLGSVTGTYVNGAAVAGKLEVHDGDRVVIGVSRLIVAIKSLANAPELELVVEESSFHYKRAGPTNYQGPREKWVQSDADRWVQSEVRFGRMPVVRRASWAAGLLALGACVWVLATPGGERVLQPEALAGNHARLIQDCGGCHQGVEPGSVEGCITCHGDLFPRRHPFLDGEEHAGNPSRGVVPPDRACLLCHVGHHETEPLPLVDGATDSQLRLAFGKPATDIARASIDHPSDGSLPRVCAECHRQEPGAKSDPNRTRIQELAVLHAGSQQDTTNRNYAFERFSHASHLAAMPEAACAVCHAPVESGQTQGASWDGDLEFAPVRFEHCAQCHVRGAALVAVDSSARAVVERAQARLAGSARGLLEMDWHGSESGNCEQCHVERFRPELRQVERSVELRAFAFESRSHAAEVERFKGREHACQECHADLSTLAGGDELAAQPFLHELHAVTLFPRDSAEARAGSQHCTECHAEQWGATSTANSTAVATETACSTCHGSTPTSPNGVPRTSRLGRSTRRAAEFSHALHSGVADGCFACHEWQLPDAGASDDVAGARAVLRPGVADCSACHAAHANIENDSCTYCHGADPKGDMRGDARLFHGQSFERSDWPAALRFSHFSQGTGSGPTSGHRSLVFDESGPAGCFRCHPAENLRAAQRVSDVRIPDGGRSECIKCHALEGTWFHWQLPPPK